jgi:hypothetical protein
MPSTRNSAISSALSRRNLLLGLAAGTAGAAGLIGPSVAAAPETNPILHWYDASVAGIKQSHDAVNERSWAITWLAAARVLRKGPADPAWQQAALAGAVHQSITGLFPDSTLRLAGALDTALGRIPDGTAKTQGLAAGRAAADASIADRTADKIDPGVIDQPFVAQEGPGVWLSEGGNSFMSRSDLARPFVLDRVDQFRPATPPTLDSERYRIDLAEVRTDGGASSTTRTPEMVAVANFWLGSGLQIYTPVLRAVLEQPDKSFAEKAKLVALFHAALVDSHLATYEAKYHYRRWRPIAAIRKGLVDPDPTWLPFHGTPGTPDYPSAHNSYSGCSEGILKALVGPQAARPFTSTANGNTRTYTEWEQLSRENLNARVWSGIHFRAADEAGRKLGLDIAAHTIRNADRLLQV